jgi:hypothetical protein
MTEAQARHEERIKKERKSLVPHMNVVIGTPRMAACGSCGESAVMLHYEGAENPYSVRCKNASLLSHRGGSKVAYGKTERGAAVVWNRQQGHPTEEHAESAAPVSSGIVFPEMDAGRFAELHARWLAKQRDPNRGAPTAEAQAKFQAHHDRMRVARKKQAAEQHEAKAPREWAL